MDAVGYFQVSAAFLVPSVLLASWIDLRHHKVPNWLNLFLVLSGFTAQAVFNGWAGLWAGLLGMLLGLLLRMLLGRNKKKTY